MISRERIKEVINNYDNKLIELQEKYNKEISNIENDTRFTDEARRSEIQKTWEAYRKVEDKILDKQNNEAMELLQERREKAKTEFEKLKNKSINESSLTEKDIAYVSGMLLNADDETLIGIAEQYNHDIFILNLINSRDAKKPDFVNRENQSNQSSRGIANNKLVVKHPLELIENERVQEDYPSQFNITNAIPSTKPFSGLWD